MMSVVGFLGTVALAAGVIALWHVFWKVTSAGSATVAAEDAGTGHMEGEPERAPADERPVGVPIGRRAWSWIADRRALTVSLAVLVVACVAHRVVLGAWPWWEEHWMLSLIFLGEVVAVAAIAASASTHKGWRLTVSVLVTAVVLTFYGWITGLMPPVLWHALSDDALQLPVVTQLAGPWAQVHAWVLSVVHDPASLNLPLLVMGGLVLFVSGNEKSRGARTNGEEVAANIVLLLFAFALPYLLVFLRYGTTVGHVGERVLLYVAAVVLIRIFHLMGVVLTAILFFWVVVLNNAVTFFS